ncbi:MAG: DUF5666 domain-containing protein [Thermoanaerobaculia bacterium]|nr:DUF5666 domain-containing protein [Thermoanaerobaculia bacterium]
MTTRSLLARIPRRSLPFKTSSALVVALLLFTAIFGAGPLEPRASADGTAWPLPARPSTVEGTVSKVAGPVLDLIEGGIQIDVTHATITGGDDRFASPVPWSGILVGARVVAQVTVPEVFPAVFPPPPLVATSVVVFQTRAGQLAGTIQSVDVAGGKFTMLIHTVSTNAATKWSGFGPNGSVKGLRDLSAGMFATVSVVNSGEASGVRGLLATSVEAYGLVTPPELIAFRGPVQTISAASWTIAGRVVTIDADTKILGDPKVGDTVDVLARVQNPPPGSLMPSYLVAVSIIKAPVITPPPGDRATEFDGIVESIPAAPTANGAPLGHWKISSRDVIVNGLTKLDTGIVVGSVVHVKGRFGMASAAGGSLVAMQFVATEIRKK